MGAGLGSLIYHRADRWRSSSVSADAWLPDDPRMYIQPEASAAPFVILFGFFAMIAIIAALTAKSCKVPIID